jgi:transposase
MNISVLGVDIAKNIFQLHGVDSSGKRILKQGIAREKLSTYVANLPLCTIVIESCGGANDWARVGQRQGHTVKLISPPLVKPLVKTNKHDANDAEAIVEAASRPSMHFVPIKQVEQQDIQSLHRVRSRLVKNRTALINEIRGLNLEYGIAIPQGALKVKSYLRSIIDDKGNELTVSSRELMQELYDELLVLEERLKKIGQKVKYICKENDQCRRLLSMPGIGELTATAIVAAVPNANEFKNGRHMAAWLGLVPRQSSSANKQLLLGISKRGDRYLPTLLIHGARAALCRCKNTDSKYSEWLTSKKESLSLNKAAVALANKNARIIWSLLKTAEEFNSNQQKVAA